MTGGFSNEEIEIPNQETLVKLVELQMNQFLGTRDTKTRINIAIWTFFVASAVFASKSENEVPKGWSLFLIGALFFGLVLLHGLWMYRIQESLNYDKKMWVLYRDHLDKLNGINRSFIQIATSEIIVGSSDSHQDDAESKKITSSTRGIKIKYILFKKKYFKPMGGEIKWVFIETGTTFLLAVLVFLLVFYRNALPAVSQPAKSPPAARDK